ncbi:MAG: integration host factor subunit beta [Gammaproteobacteria bacterium]|nr:integration host factor subunit beta [Gammaproteobacteria bacterium]
MTKSELIESLVRKQSQLGYRDVELAVKTMLEHMGQTLATGERIEIRGFGSFSLHYRPPRVGRNPKSGDPVSLPAKYVPHFKPGKELRERVNLGAVTAPEIKLARDYDPDTDGDLDNDLLDDDDES